MTKLDKDGDGKITLDEFRHLFKQSSDEREKKKEREREREREIREREKEIKRESEEKIITNVCVGCKTYQHKGG